MISNMRYHTSLACFTPYDIAFAISYTIFVSHMISKIQLLNMISKIRYLWLGWPRLEELSEQRRCWAQAVVQHAYTCPELSIEKVSCTCVRRSETFPGAICSVASPLAWFVHAMETQHLNPCKASTEAGGSLRGGAIESPRAVVYVVACCCSHSKKGVYTKIFRHLLLEPW